MRVITHRTLVNYYEANPQAKSAIESWYKTVKKAEWANFADMKKILIAWIVLVINVMFSI